MPKKVGLFSSTNPQPDGDAWIKEILSRTKPFHSEKVEKSLIIKLLDEISLRSDKKEKSLHLAAAFDLLVAAEYYGSVAHVGWVYCPEGDSPLLLYPYINACPRCLLKDQFVYHKANKPQSGSIGATTSRLLALFLAEIFHRKGLSIEIKRGTEPVDLIFQDQSSDAEVVFFAEVKAAPLCTLPLAVRTQELTEEIDSLTETVSHRETDHTGLYGSEIGIYLPIYKEDENIWDGRIFPLGTKKEKNDTAWAYTGLLNLLNSDSTFLESYFRFWKDAFECYGTRKKNFPYWFTNACGSPDPRPDDWPKRPRVGYETISDGKTSVGMDRTDDLKKATYQVLKIGAEGKPAYNFDYKVGIVTNIPAVRHFEAYMSALKDIIWTRDESRTVRSANDLPPDTRLFNLVDGIVSLIEVSARDEWIRSTFTF